MKEQMKQVKEYPEGTVTVISVTSGKVVTFVLTGDPLLEFS